MTRKRFVKQLMSIGYSRNEANTEARAAVSLGISYESRFLYILYKKCGLVPADWFERVGDAVGLLSQKINAMVHTIVEVMPTIIEAITAAIPQVIANIERMRQDVETDTE